MSDVKVCLNEDGTLDEVVTHAPVTAHLERTSPGGWWLRIGHVVVEWTVGEKEPSVTFSCYALGRIQPEGEDDE